MADMTSSGQSGGPGPEQTAGSGVGPRADRPQRRVFSPAYKLRIIGEYEALTGHGARAGLLRREGLYDSHLRKWIAARDGGRLGTRENPAAPAGSVHPDAGRESVEIRRLKAENARLAAELAKTKAVLDVMGKAHALFEVLSESADTRTAPR